jgi:DnaJ-class molecular chaperone
MEYEVVMGTLNNSVKIIENEGNITKFNGKFIRGNVAIIIKYDISTTNTQLLDIAKTHNIKYISELNDIDDNGDIHYTYGITALELIIGIEFNLILPNGRIMLIKIPHVNLSEIKTIKNHGLPQLLFEHSSEVENKNIIINFKIKDQNYNCNGETKKYLLEQFSSQLPHTYSDNIILVKFER